MYEVAEALRSALILHFKETYSIGLTFNDNWEISNLRARELHNEIINLPHTFFPNEFGKRLPFPFLEEINKNRYLVFEIGNAEITDLSGFKISSTTSGDGFSRSFRFPFFVPQESKR